MALFVFTSGSDAGRDEWSYTGGGTGQVTVQNARYLAAPAKTFRFAGKDFTTREVWAPIPDATDTLSVWVSIVPEAGGQARLIVKESAATQSIACEVIAKEDGVYRLSIPSHRCSFPAFGGEWRTTVVCDDMTGTLVNEGGHFVLAVSARACTARTKGHELRATVSLRLVL